MKAMNSPLTQANASSGKTRPKVLVTGGCGYIGSHTVLELMERYEIVVVDNLSRGHRDAIPAIIPFYQEDLRDRTAMANIMRKEAIDAVVHFAAFAYVGESMVDPGLYFDNNVNGTLQLLEAMRETGVGRIVLSSSCAVYGIPQVTPITENTPPRPMNPYGESKLMAEQLLKWYEAIHGIKYIALRYFNACGADPKGRAGERHEPEPHLIPRILMTANRQCEHFEILGADYPTPDGTCVRDYIHVTDLACGHFLALQYLDAQSRSATLNLGTGTGLSVQQMLNAVTAVTGRNIVVRVQPRRPGDPPELVADPSLAKQLLGWNPTHSTPEIILQTAWNYLLEEQKPPFHKTVAAGE